MRAAERRPVQNRMSMSAWILSAYNEAQGSHERHSSARRDAATDGAGS